jgi:signal transduction histidine kinase
MSNRILHICIGLLSLLGIATGTISVSAQNNPLKIDDDLYAYYDKCQRSNKSEIVLKMADTLFTRAGEINDVKAQCLSFYIKGLYYYYTKDIDKLEEELNRSMKFSEKTPYSQYTFGIWNNIVLHYANNGNYPEALRQLGLMQKKAIELKSIYGIGASYVKYGDIYGVLGNNDASIAEFKKAVDYYKSVDHTKDMYDVYERIASRYLMMGNYDSAEKFALKAIEEKSNADGYAGNYLCLINIYVAKKEDDKVEFYLGKLNDWEKHYQLSYNQKKSKDQILIKYYIQLGKYDEAQKLIESSSLRQESRDYEMYSMRRLQGNYKEALSYYENNRKLFGERTNSIQADQIANYSSLLENNQLKMENDELALKNAQMSIKDLEAKRKLMLLQQAHNTLQLKNKNLELKNKKLQIISQKAKTEKIRAEVQRQREKSALLASQMKAKKQADILIISILALFLLLLSTYLLFRSIQAKKLSIEKDREAHTRKEAQKALAEAEEADKLKILFLKNVSHEIRTPLNSIVGFTELISDSGEIIPKAEKENFRNIIHTNSQSLTVLIDDILDLSKMESGAYKVQLMPSDLNALCEEVLAEFKGKQSAGVDLELDVPDNHFFLNTDRVRLSQLLENLMSNACKNTTAGKIVLSYSVADKDIVFAVTDTGCGIAPSDTERVFQSFEKIDSFKQGVGLGLNICRDIATMLHGEIHIDTSYTQGARFIFRHPITIKC